MLTVAMIPGLASAQNVTESHTIMVYEYDDTGAEDTAYADACFEGGETRGARSNGCIPHRQTNSYSVLDLNPWYMTNVQCAGSCILDGGDGPYVGPLYRGQENMHRYINRLVQPGEDTAVDVCNLQVEPNSNTDPYDPAAARNELDGCTNQYILHRSGHPRIPLDNQGELPDINEGREQAFCQPMDMQPLGDVENTDYRPSDYYITAWQKTMEDPGYLARGGAAPKEPSYAELGVDLNDPIAVRDDFGVVEVNDLVEPWGDPTGRERIYDPTHPFSPRWDFVYNEREHFSPGTVVYSHDPVNAVRCAGGHNANIIPTDVMAWRQTSFELYMTWRIRFNVWCRMTDWGWISCWNFFNGAADAPPCPTRYNGAEKVENRLGRGIRQLLCGPPHIEDLCEHITKPVAPANVLKMRDEGEAFAAGAPPGYTFAEYFDNHRPYMRCWDTGMECGRAAPPDVGEGEVDGWLTQTAGANYAIVGAGRENQSCTMGGAPEGSSQVDGGANPIMNWMEFKLYALRGMRKGGLNCLPQHEKLYKPSTGEELIGNRAGGQYQRRTPDSTGQMVRYTTFPWPLQWRGYVNDPNPETRYPNFGSPDGTAPLRGTGLDNARAGEILIFDQDVVQAGEPGTWRQPYLAFVTEVCNAGAACPPSPSHWVKAIAYNHGKFPDACGNTDNMEMGEEYTMYQGALPAYNQSLYAGVGPHTTTCDDPSNSACTEQYWGTVKRYFPKDDQRRD